MAHDGGMTEQEPAETTRESDPEGGADDGTTAAPTRLRDRTLNLGTAVAACVATLLVGGVVGASLGALAASNDDDHRMTRHMQPGQPWQRGGPPGVPGPGSPGRGDGERGWQRMPRPQLTDEQREQMREWMRQWREDATTPDGSTPTPTPSPGASKG